MGCDASRLTCAVEEISRALRSEPSLMNWVATLGPLLIGLMTVGVAITSVLLARQSKRVSEASVQVAERSNALASASHELSLLMREEAREVQNRQERDDFAAEISAWLDSELIYLATEQEGDRKTAVAKVRRVTAMAAAMTSSPNAIRVLVALERLVDAAPQLNPEWDKADWVRIRAEWILRPWQHDPENMTDEDMPDDLY